MNNLIKKGEAILICGRQDVGKSTLARIIAANAGAYKEATEDELKNNAFGFGNLLYKESAATIIVDEFTDFEFAKNLITNEYIEVNLMCEKPRQVKLPNFIFIAKLPGIIKHLPRDSRRFKLIEIK